MKKKTDKKGRFRKTVAYQAILLGGSALVATTLLSFGNLATKDAIVLRLEEDLKASISQVVAADLFDNDLLASTTTATDEAGNSVLVYQATKNGQVAAVIFEVSENGYSGVIRSLMAVSPDGTILGVRIISHSETPGLGDKIEIAKDKWVLGFGGLSLKNPAPGDWRVKKDGGYFDQFTGATITPRAVVRSIRAGLQLFELRKQELLGINTDPRQPSDSADVAREGDDVGGNK